ncbi:MAG: signal recognition particle-docking protein FtsY [Legionellaceae bacterium]|nr:signal recognition particle-docking protein FtsY [Legionellaceae bacterium]
MIKWLKKNQKSGGNVAELDNSLSKEISPAKKSSDDSKQGVFARFKRGLSKTRGELGDSIANLLLGKKEIDAELLEELETILLMADLGLDTTKNILSDLKGELKRKQLDNSEAIFFHLKKYLQQLLSANVEKLDIDGSGKKPFVILTIGVNGAGKTTTIGKLAKQYQQQGKSVMLAAGDTFRAAAVEQLQVWGERNNIPVIAQHTGADSASVIFDGFQAAKARGIDILIADTAGRLHTQNNLMEELKKVKRVLEKIDPTAPHEVMLVLDASIGQNALNQARQFHSAIGLTGITITKLDGTAKGGMLFAIATELGIPFRYIGIGEGIDDLRAFDAAQFVDAIFDDQIQSGQ